MMHDDLAVDEDPGDAIRILVRSVKRGTVVDGGRIRYNDVSPCAFRENAAIGMS